MSKTAGANLKSLLLEAAARISNFTDRLIGELVNLLPVSIRFSKQANGGSLRSL